MRAKELRKGTTVIFNNEIHMVVEFRHFTPGNKRAFVQASLKNIQTGKIIQNRFSPDDDLERAILDSKLCQYLYQDHEGYHFMDMESYNNFALSEDVLGEGRYYLKENMEIRVDFHEGNPVMPEFPKVVILKVTDSPPGVKGDSVTSNMKPAVCETGLKLQVPLFIEEGTEIKVNTDTGEYAGRA